MRQMVELIYLGRLNLDQAAVQLQVNRKTVRHWVNKVEQEAETTKKIDSELPCQPPGRKKTATSNSPGELKASSMN